MSAIDWNQVVAFEVSLASAPAEVQNDILDYVNNVLNVAEFGGEDSPKLRLARIYLAAHFGSLATTTSGSGETGPLVEETIGPLSRKYATLSASDLSDADLGATSWGRQYQALARTIPTRALVL